MDDKKVNDNEDARSSAEQDSSAPGRGSEQDAQAFETSSGAKTASAKGSEQRVEPEDDEGDDDDERVAKNEKGTSKTRAAAAPAAVARRSKGTPRDKAPAATPASIPMPARQNQLMVGLGSAGGGLLSFWLAWDIYDRSIAKQHVNYYSHAAWLFLIAYFFMTMATYAFVRLERAAPDPKTPVERAEASVRQPAAVLAPPVVLHGVDRVGIVLAVLLCGPFYALYWWQAGMIWAKTYALQNSGMWVIFVALLLSASAGAFHAIRPPSERDERAHRMPTRRVILLMMLPFGMVFGMIWLASLYPPWP
ncbi:MAG: hypothetical protein MUF54_20700 [Polyangiaceae bacterium]|jgi:hypothetical protein|nr:hypothetical protein [Polyangiaceae bacterium]